MKASTLQLIHTFGIALWILGVRDPRPCKLKKLCNNIFTCEHTCHLQRFARWKCELKHSLTNKPLQASGVRKSLLKHERFSDLQRLQTKFIQQFQVSSSLCLGMWADGAPCKNNRKQSLQSVVLNAPYFLQASDLRISNTGYPKYFQAKERTWASVTGMPLYSSRARLRGQHPQVLHDGAAFDLGGIAWKRYAGRDVCRNPGLLGRVLGAVSRNDLDFICWRGRTTSADMLEVDNNARWRQTPLILSCQHLLSRKALLSRRVHTLARIFSSCSVACFLAGGISYSSGPPIFVYTHISAYCRNRITTSHAPASTTAFRILIFCNGKRPVVNPSAPRFQRPVLTSQQVKLVGCIPETSVAADFMDGLMHDLVQHKLPGSKPKENGTKKCMTFVERKRSRCRT